MRSRDAIKSDRYKRYIGLWLLPGLFASILMPLSTQTAFASSLSRTVQDAVVWLKPGYGAEDLLSIKGVESAVALYRDSEFSGRHPAARVYMEPGQDALAALSDSFFVERVSENYPVTASAITVNDPHFTSSPTEIEKAWWLAKVGVPKAWEISKGSAEVTVAVVDTGVNGKHEDLADGRVGGGYYSYCQTPGSGGKCAVHVSGTISAGANSDNNGHGTFIAGIIGAIPNNARGIAGVNWQVRLLPVKVLDADGAGVSSDVAAGIVWAVDNGADIINLSLGGTSLQGNAVLADAVKYAGEMGALVVAAAGNDASLIGSDLDIERVFPVCTDGTDYRVLGVTAVDATDKRAPFSNYGRACIDLTAPGTTAFTDRENQKGIVSTYYDPGQPSKNNLYASVSGTSVAAAIVSGVAALVKSAYPDLSVTSLHDRLAASAENIDSLNPDNCGGLNCTGRLGSGRLNAYRAAQTTTFISDAFLKDSIGRIYKIENGLLRAVSEFVFRQRGFDPSRVTLVATSEKEKLLLGEPLPPIDGTLVRGGDEPTVYLVSGGVLLPVSLLAFRSHGFDFGNVVVLPDSEIALYRKGPNFLPANGALLIQPGKPAVYFLHEGRRRLLSAFVFRNRGFRPESIVEVEEVEFSRYPEDSVSPLQPPLDGTLIRAEGSPAVYLVQDAQLRLLSERAFLSGGLRGSPVAGVPESELAGYPVGPPID